MFKIETMTTGNLAGSGHEFIGRAETNHGGKGAGGALSEK